MKSLITVLLVVFCSMDTFASVQEAAVKLIARNEGYRANPYLCSAGKLTIGYGFTSKTYTSKKFMSKTEADRILNVYVTACIESVNRLPIRVKLTDSQIVVMADMIYHFGSGSIHTADDLLTAINSGSSYKVKTQLRRWVYTTKRDSSGKVISKTKVAGLVNRQERLCNLWDK